MEEGSFTAAADRLGLSRSVVSKYISRLEERLGARLMHRTTRRLSLTEAGRVFFERSARALEEIEMAEMEVSQLQSAPRGELRISAPVSFGLLHLMPAMPAFLDSCPDVTVDLQLRDEQVDLLKEGVDVAVRIAELPDSSMVARRLAPCNYVVCATPDYLARKGVPRKPQDLQSHSCLVFAYHDSPNQWHFAGADGQQISVPVSGAIRSNNSLALSKAVQQSMGLVLAPTFMVGEALASGSLKALLTDWRLQALSIYAVYPQRKYLSPKVRAFLDFLAERLASPPYWDAFIKAYTR